MFLVPKGTLVKVKKARAEFYPKNIKDHVTKKDNLFDKHEVVLDPIGKLGCCQNDHVIGGHYEKAGYYGFLREGWQVIVSANKVQYLG